MKKISLAGLAVLFITCLTINHCLACTTFCLISKHNILFGRNYDFSVGDGLIFINKRGVAKEATVQEGPNPVKWVSKFGSVTFNQFGRENPTGGMNEMGMVVEEMWLDETEYPKADSRPTIDTQQWIQYLLDTSATTAEAIKNAESVRILSEVKVHYLISDQTGRTAAIEFVKGKMVVHTGQTLTARALANDTYEKSIAYKRVKARQEVSGDGSLNFFVRAARKAEAFAKQSRSSQEALSYAFAVLNNVSSSITQWSIVYDITRRRIYFRTSHSPQIKSIETKAFDYSCSTAVTMLDIDTKESGDVTGRFVNYARQANRDLIERSFAGTDFLASVSGTDRDSIASYPEVFTCTAP